MDSRTTVSSVDEWLDLPELDLPVLTSEKEEGAVYWVHKVGFLAVSLKDCTSRNIQGVRAIGDKCVLSTAMVDFGGVKTLCRISSDLESWVEECVVRVYSGLKIFPFRVEFGRLKGSAYAQHII